MAKYIVKHRRGTAAQWATKDIIPQEGELVIEIDEIHQLHKLKIGDGVHPYSELNYLQAGDELVTQVLARAIPRTITVTLDVNKWTEVTCATDPRFGYYGQEIEIDNITEYSRLDLQPSADMLAEFQHLDLVFVTENKEGTITVYSIGDMPLKTYTMQATIVETEITVEDKTDVIGTTVGTPTTNIVKYTEQTLTEEQKAQARANIGIDARIDALKYEHPETHPASMITGLADVATSGSYTDLLNRPTKVSAFENDSNYLTSYTETDPTVPSWAKASTKPTYTASEVGAEASGAVSTHNTATDTHNDIRLLIEGLTQRLNTVANSDDINLDQLSEIVAYIKNNKSVIEGITTNKINVSDIVDNLTTNVANKPLSAAQGVAVKAQIDGLQQSFNTHKHNDVYYTESEVDNLLNTKASATYTNPEPLLKDVGGILASQHTNGFNNVPISDLITELLYPYTAPVINSFSLSPAAGAKEMNVSLTVNSATVKVTKKSKAIESVSLYKGNTLLETKTNEITSSGTTLTFTINETLNGSADTSYYIKVTEVNGTTISSSAQTYDFVYPYFYGVITNGATIDANTINGFTKSIRAKGSHTYTYTTSNQCPVIAYPKSYGALKSIIDPNNFTQDWTQTIVAYNGVDYYVYVGGASTATATYKFNY